MSKRAIILAGGKGTRLQPYTVVLPKPLMPIQEYPILEIIIRQLAKSGFTHITLAVNHLAEIIQAFFGDGSKWDIKIDYSVEEIPLSTIAPLKLIDDLPDNFLLLNGDILTDLNFADFYNLHKNNNNLFTISSFEREIVSEYGELEISNEGQLVKFREKPVTKILVSMGVYMANRKILNFVPPHSSFGFDNLMRLFLVENIPVNVRTHTGYWLDIGRPDDYRKAIEDFNDKRKLFLKD